MTSSGGGTNSSFQGLFPLGYVNINIGCLFTVLLIAGTVLGWCSMIAEIAAYKAEYTPRCYIDNGYLLFSKNAGGHLGGFRHSVRACGGEGGASEKAE